MSLFSRNDREPSVIMRADRAREAGQWQLAASLYRIALDRRPKNPAIWIQFGHALKECGNRTEAEAAYRTAIGYRPDDADAHLQLGHVLKLQGNLAEAKAAYSCALAIDGSLEDAARELRGLGAVKAYIPRAGDRAVDNTTIGEIPSDSARKTVAVLTRLKRQKTSIITRADRAREAGQWTLAARFYFKALDRNPNRSDIWVQYGHSLKESGNFAEAERAYRAAIVRDSTAADPHLQLGHVLKLQNKRPEAAAAYLCAFARGPSSSDPLQGLLSLGWTEREVTQLRRSADRDVGTARQRLQLTCGSQLEASASDVRLLENRAAEPLSPVPKELVPQIYFYIDTIFMNDTLMIEGWLFHDTMNVQEIAVLVTGNQPIEPVHAKCGIARADVVSGFSSSAQKRPGFLAKDIKLSPTGCNKITLRVKLENGDEVAVNLIELQAQNSSWTMQRLTDRCTEKLLLGDAIANTRWMTRGSSLMKSLAEIFSTISISANRLRKLPRPVTVLVSVYNGIEYLKPFFTSLLTNTRSEFSCILIDNGNTDTRICTYLRALAAAHENITLIRVDKNRGYVGAMCLGIEYAPKDQHVVVLNTDTVLPQDWIERLVWPLFIDESIASTTPFTNSGTVCSFPKIGVDNPLFLGMSVEIIDQMFERVQADKLEVMLPSGVGFCMAHNRAAINEIGWYDFAAFGSGYGEENDWCLRAQAAGFRNILVPNLFIYHKHGAIYAAEKQALLERSLSIVNERYPQYHQDVTEFYFLDPVGPLRDLIAFLLACDHGQYTLIIDHTRGGGSNLFRDRLIEELIADSHCVALVSCSEGIGLTADLIGGSAKRRFEMRDFSDILALVRHVAPKKILVNQLVDFPDAADTAANIILIAAQNNAKITIFVHDYYLICPSLNLLNHKDRFCDIPDLPVCDVCVKKNPHLDIAAAQRENFNISGWRSEMAKLLSAANDIVCFSRVSAGYLMKAYPFVSNKLKVLPHFTDLVKLGNKLEVTNDTALRIAVIGGIHEAKGSKIVLSLAQSIMSRVNETVSLTVIGSISDELAGLGVVITGPYSHDELASELERHAINLVFIPSIWPETFCYVAEEVMTLGLPLVVFDIGAPAERVRLYAKGAVIPICDGEVLLQTLLQCSLRIRSGPEFREDTGLSGTDVLVISRKE
jgi:GT2 family glycosyltransferase/Tfp pilus assembly protein PilF/glycosyltransferase involved in cell wall biosynthesis